MKEGNGDVAIARPDQQQARKEAIVPGYKERLAFGTDQGRWLVEQIGSRPDAERAPRRRGSRPVARAYHTCVPSARYHRLADERGADPSIPPEALGPPQAQMQMQGSSRGFLIAGFAGVGFLTLIALFLLGRI